MSVANFARRCLPSIVLALLSLSCGGGSSMMNTASNTAPATPPPGSSSPGTGSGGGSSPSGGSPSSAATYVYVASSISPSAPVVGFRLDASAPSIAELAGSPFGKPTTGRGSLVVNRNFVYIAVQNDPITTTILAMRADASSGGLTEVGETTFTSFGAALVRDPSGHNLYAILSGGNIASFIINSDGTLSSAGPPLHLADGIAAAAMSPNGQTGYAITETQLSSDPRGPSSLAIVLLHRDPNSGTLSLSRQVSSDRAFQLKIDPTGKYLVAVKDDFKHFLVYRINDSTSDLTAVAGSPFMSAGNLPAPDFTRPFDFSPDGRFVYAVNTNGVNERPASIWVFALDANSGTLTQIQTFDLPPGSNYFNVAVENSLMILIANANDSRITLIRRDPNTGQLSAGGNPLGGYRGLQEIGVMHF